MQNFDVAMKAIVLRPASLFLGQISGVRKATWLDVQLPVVENRRVDLLGKTPAGDLIQIEFQSTNDPNMVPFREATGRLSLGKQGATG